jgi:endonuclease I/PKD repeat protein
MRFTSIRLIHVTLIFLLFNINQAWSQAPPGYYDTVDETSPAALKASLHNIIKDHTKIPYTSSSTDTWDVLELAGEDVDNTNNVIALYKNATYAKVSGGNTNYNREHSWPKSYGFPNDGSTNYPYTDMHHLFIANSSYNSSRSNKPFDICTSGCTEKPTDVNNGRGGTGQSNFTKTGVWDVWQERQGDVARALFYLAVRYEGGTHGITGVAEPNLELTDDLALINASQTGSNESTAYMGLLSVLITWSNSDPVDIYEHMHNEAVYNGQGNRNPFIDNPAWAKCVFELVCNGGGSDTTAPNAPMSLTGNGSIVGQNSLDWFNNTESDLAGYNIYRSNTSGGTFNQLNTTLIGSSFFTDSSITAGSTYFYKVTASDNTGNESVFSTEISVTAASSSANSIQNGVVKTELSGALSSQQFFVMDIPVGATNLSFNISGGTGDADLYVRFGALPTLSTYDCRPYVGGNSEDCPIANIQAGTYQVMIVAYSAFSGLSLTGSYTEASTNSPPSAGFTSNCTDLSCSFDASTSSDSDGIISSYAWSFGATGVDANNTFASAGTYSVTLTVTDNDGATNSSSQSITVTAPPIANVLSNGVAVTELSATKDNALNYTMVVPSGASLLSFVISGGTGDADIYVRFGSAPTTSNYDCRPYIGGNNETCNISVTQAGTYYVMVRAYATFSGVSLTGSYSTGLAGQVFSSTSNVNIPDNDTSGATSNIAVNRSGAANNVKITYSIVHTYIGDLTVQLVDPSGAVTTLRSNTGGSANDINEFKTINKGSATATGTWGLKVIDGAGADTGYIDSWSIEFL